MSNTLIIGPSSSGKSTAIARLYMNDFSKEKTKIIYAYEFDNKPSPVIPDNAIIHINMFHVWKNDANCFDQQICDSPVMIEIIRQKTSRNSVVFVIEQSKLLERILKRTYILGITTENNQLYPKDIFINFIQKIPMYRIYKKWIEFLCGNNFDVEYIYSGDYSYRQICSSEEVLEIVSR
jgi:hypothetical protein